MMIYSDPDNDSTVEQLLGAIAILALLAAIFAWAGWVVRNDERARRELAAEQCGAAQAAYISIDDGRIVCLGGSGRSHR